MLKATRETIENFKQKSREEQIEYANLCSVGELEILHDAGYSFVVEDGKVMGVEEEVEFDEKNLESAG